ncbi:hypothetical protein CABS01_13974 [Colletotrichum abscissum]|uniref:uncharacterized protein n=1 Tax=Colletotrichum abscissum TaxID=1671311 RepID=UPI0027D64A9F|nr:uncharacterized protein CABS01_13974 [Colletotrichum abscissum]KAK1483822.1 hypothetical protein CABS01_13974 [Colletotrichum abscissum]
MVYYGALNLVFRDERQRIRKKIGNEAGSSSKPRNLPINYALCLNIEDRAATFFFTHYTTTGPPFCDSAASQGATIMFESWNDSHAWTAHIEGATALLHLRGKGQFTRELGIQLYIQFRQQILQACMHRGVPVPPALVEITMQFEASRRGTQYNSLRPGSLAVLGFRLVNLSAAMNTQQITDANAIYRIAVDIDSDLNAWASKSSQSDRKFHEIEADASKKENNFNGREHVYNSVWGAQVWNNWRSLTIVTNRIILNHVDKQSFENNELKEIMRFHSTSVIHSLSADICTSTPSLSGTPRAPSMIWPLHIVSQEELNVPNVRSWAVEQLIGIRKLMGIKQAAVLATTMG